MIADAWSIAIYQEELPRFCLLHTNISGIFDRRNPGWESYRHAGFFKRCG
jgi:hypothetical protein